MTDDVSSPTAPDLLAQEPGVQAALEAWFEDNAGTRNATDAATGAVRYILMLHQETLVRYEDDSQPICNECGHDWDGFDLPGCPTVRAIVHNATTQGFAWRSHP